MTTVALDFGCVTIDHDLKVYLFGTPGQDRFGFMWRDLAQGALGALVIVDARRIDDCYPAVDYFERIGLAFVVGINTFDGVLLSRTRRRPVGVGDRRRCPTSRVRRAGQALCPRHPPRRASPQPRPGTQEFARTGPSPVMPPGWPLTERPPRQRGAASRSRRHRSTSTLAARRAGAHPFLSRCPRPATLSVGVLLTGRQSVRSKACHRRIVVRRRHRRRSGSAGLLTVRASRTRGTVQGRHW